jgi:iron complex transport system ATP-binding protein
MFSKCKDSAVKLLNFSQEKNNEEIIGSTSYSFPKGRVGIVVGKSESQKAHFLRAIAGYELGTTGDIVICDKSVRNSGSEYKKNVFIVSPYVQFNLPCAISHVPGILMGFYENWDFATYRTWIDYLGLAESVPYSQLSTGSKMKALIAIAMASGAEVLLFEDVDSYLDSEQQKTLMNALQLRCATGLTAILGSRRLTRWVNSDVDLYSFKDTTFIRVDATALKRRIENGESEDRIMMPMKNGWTRQNKGEENTATMTMTFIAS